MGIVSKPGCQMCGFVQKTVENPKFPAFSHEVKQLKETEGRAAGLAEGRVAGQTEARDNMAEALRAPGFPETAIQEALRRSREQDRLAN